MKKETNIKSFKKIIKMKFLFIMRISKMKQINTCESEKDMPNY